MAANGSNEHIPTAVDNEGIDILTQDREAESEVAGSLECDGVAGDSQGETQENWDDEELEAIDESWQAVGAMDPGASSEELVSRASSALASAEVRRVLGPETVASPALLFDSIACNIVPGLREHLEASFDVVALPGESLEEVPQIGNIVIIRALGEGDLALAEVIVEECPESAAGLHARVVPLDESSSRADVRRLTDSFGRLDHRTLILRANGKNVPEGVEQVDGSSPEAQFLDDLQTGTAKALEYLEYTAKAIGYAEKYDLPIPDGVREAGRNVQKIADRVSDGLGKVGNVIDYAKTVWELKEWAESLDDLAKRTIALDLKDPETLVAWLESAKTHQKKLEPLREAVQEWLTKAALRGSRTAARASFMLSVVTAYVEVGLAALEAGTKNINAYIKRRDEIIRRAFDDPRQVPDPPLFPGPWLTAAERLKMRKAREAYLRRVRRRQQQEERRRQAIAEFNKQFPGLYRRKRRAMKQRIFRRLRKGRHKWTLRTSAGTAVIPGWGAGRWWDCFMSAEKATYFDRVAGIYITPAKERVTAKEATVEIECFAAVKPRCPYFDNLYNSNLAAFLRKRGVPHEAAESQATAEQQFLADEQSHISEAPDSGGFLERNSAIPAEFQSSEAPSAPSTSPFPPRIRAWLDFVKKNQKKNETLLLFVKFHPQPRLGLIRGFNRARWASAIRQELRNSPDLNDLVDSIDLELRIIALDHRATDARFAERYKGEQKLREELDTALRRILSWRRVRAWQIKALLARSHWAVWETGEKFIRGALFKDAFPKLRRRILRSAAPSSITAYVGFGFKSIAQERLKTDERFKQLFQRERRRLR